MKTIVKIKTIGFSKLNNLEYLNFMSRFRGFYATFGGDDRPEEITVINESFGVLSDELKTFDEDLNLMADLCNQSHISNETAKMKKVDKERDSLSVYFTSTIVQLTKSPQAEEREAAQIVNNQSGSYIGTYRKARQQKTKQIEGLLIDMRKADMNMLVEQLNMKKVLDSLEAANREYQDLTAKRTNNKLNLISENTSQVRARLNVMYQYMVNVSFGHSIVNANDEIREFIKQVNLLVNETNASFNQRKGLLKSKKPSDRPEDI